MTTQDPSTNYSWNVPADAGDTGVWGAALNAIIADDVTGIDAIVKAVSDAAVAAQATADAALPATGGTMTGEITHLTSVDTLSPLGDITSSQDLDLDVANAFTATVTGAVTIQATNVPTGLAWFILHLTNGGSSTVTWDGSFQWAGGTAPTLTTSGVDIIVGISTDGGTTWNVGAQLDMS